MMDDGDVVCVADGRSVSHIRRRSHRFWWKERIFSVGSHKLAANRQNLIYGHQSFEKLGGSFNRQGFPIASLCIYSSL